jgi:hypothetical protein
MNTSKGKNTARVVALAASIAVSLGVWVAVAKPPPTTMSSAIVSTSGPDPTFNINDAFLSTNPAPGTPGAGQASPSVQPSPVQPSPTVQTVRSPRVRTRAS